MSAAAPRLTLNDPRENLARGLAILRGFQDRIDYWRKAAAELEAKLATFETSLSALTESEKTRYAAWSEDMSLPRPADFDQQKREMQAHIDAASARLVTARAELEACERAAATDFGDAKAQIERAVANVLLAEAHRVGMAYKQAILESMRMEACLVGLRSYFGARQQGDAVGSIQAELNGARDGSVEAERKAIRAECAEIRSRWAAYADKLRADPDHHEEP